MRAPEFEASLMEAKLYPQLWRLGLGIVLILFMYLSLIIPITVGTVLAEARNLAQPAEPTPMHFLSALGKLQANLVGTSGISTPAFMFFVLATFAGLFIGPILAAAALHFRGPGSLFGPWDDWRRGFFTALAVQVPILAILFAVSAVFDPPQANLAFDRWLLYLPFALPLILIQTGSEELVFRGYLQQQLAARFATRWIWMGVPAVLFTLLHWTPAAGPNLPIVLLAAMTFALIAADLVEQTGNLGAAMGIHFGNNVFGMLIVAVSETLTGLALFVSPRPVGESGPMTFGIVLSIAIMLIVWRITRHLLTR